MPPKSRSKQPAPAQKRKRRDDPASEDEGYCSSSAEDDVQALDSDNLDDDDADAGKRRKKVGAVRKKQAGPTKPTKRRKKAESDGGESDLELKEGQEVVGKIVRAPKTGQGGSATLRGSTHLSQRFLCPVPPGRISQNTFNFLNQLRQPECNDREWLVPILVRFPSPRSQINN